MRFRKNFLNLYHFLLFKNRSLEKRLESFDPFDSFYFFDPKHKNANVTCNLKAQSAITLRNTCNLES